MENSNKKFSIKHIFDPGVYFECLRQLGLVALISFILINLVNILIPISIYINAASASNSEEVIYNSGNAASKIIKISCDATEICWYLFAIFVIVAPLLTLIAFNFLTKRNACDYFHAFPQKRGCIFTSYIAAIFSWLFVITFGSAAVTSTAYLLCSKYMTFSHSSLWHMSFSIFVCSLLVVTAVSIACSLTGTVFTNIITTGLILFFPRLFIFLTIECLTISNDLLLADKFMPILNYDSNLILAGFFDIDGSFLTAFPVIYTLILSLIYFVAGLLLYIKRASETAGNSAINRLLQCVFRLCLGLPLSFIVIFYLFEIISTNNWDYLTAEEIFYGFVIELICVIGMLLFELLSTKKFKNVLKALPSMLLFFAAQGVILVFALGLYAVEINYSPNASQIKYIIPNSLSYYDDYYTAKLADCKIDNDEINEIVSRSLKNTIEAIEYDREHESYHGMKESICGSNVVEVGIKSGLMVKYRRIHMTEADYSRYIDLLTNSKEIMNVYNTLPKYDDSNMYIYTDGMIYKKHEQEIYNTLREEVSSLDPQKWYSLLYSERSLFYLHFTAYVNNNYTSTDLPITLETPKTLLAFLNACNKDSNASGFNRLSKIINLYDAQPFFENNYCEIVAYDKDFTTETYYDTYFNAYWNNYGNGTSDTKLLNKANNVKKFIDYVWNQGYKELTSLEPQEGKTLIRLNFTSYEKEVYINYFTYVDDSVLEAFANEAMEEIEDENN